jgi:hypothetical protein
MQTVVLWDQASVCVRRVHSRTQEKDTDDEKENETQVTNKLWESCREVVA